MKYLLIALLFVGCATSKAIIVCDDIDTRACVEQQIKKDAKILSIKKLEKYIYEVTYR